MIAIKLSMPKITTTVLKVISAINSAMLNSNSFRHDHMGDFFQDSVTFVSIARRFVVNSVCV